MPHTDSSFDKCCDCGQSVWRALSSPKHLKAMCMPCVQKRQKAGEELEMGGLTAEQIADILAHR